MMKRVTNTLDDWLEIKKDKVNENEEGSWESVENHLFIYNYGHVKHSSKIAAFDIDGTLIITKSGKVFPENENDWQFYCPVIPQTIAEAAAEGYKIVCFTNQRGIMQGHQNPESFKRKMKKLAEIINVPLQIFVSLGTLQYRKPYIGMWNHLKDYENGDVIIELQSSFFVGDAAGRVVSSIRKKEDHSAADRLFAINIGVKFFTPEEYFLKKCGNEPFNLPTFSPIKFLEERQNLFEPAETLIPGSGLEVLVFVGYPGSGKSHLANKLAREHGYCVVSRDLLKTWQKCVQYLKTYLERGQSVIVDNTNVDTETRIRYCSVAKSFNADCRCFLFTCTIEQAMHNCKYRIICGTDKSHQDVGGLVLKTLRKKFQEPKTEEGFSEVIRVNFVPDFTSDEQKKVYRMYLCDR